MTDNISLNPIVNTVNVTQQVNNISISAPGPQGPVGLADPTSSVAYAIFAASAIYSSSGLYSSSAQISASGIMSSSANISSSATFSSSAQISASAIISSSAITSSSAVISASSRFSSSVINGLVATSSVSNSYINLSTVQPTQEGAIFYDSAQHHALNIITDTATPQELGQQMFTRVVNGDSVTLTKGTVVYFNGVQGQRPTVARAKADSINTHDAVGLMYDDLIVTGNPQGFVLIFGFIDGIKTNQFNVGDDLYVDASTAGNLTNVKPSYPNYAYHVGTVLISHPNNGRILVNTYPMYSGNTASGNILLSDGYRAVGSTNATLDLAGNLRVVNASITGLIYAPGLNTSSSQWASSATYAVNAVTASQGLFSWINSVSTVAITASQNATTASSLALSASSNLITYINTASSNIISYANSGSLNAYNQSVIYTNTASAGLYGLIQQVNTGETQALITASQGLYTWINSVSAVSTTASQNALSSSAMAISASTLAYSASIGALSASQTAVSASQYAVTASYLALQSSAALITASQGLFTFSSSATISSSALTTASFGGQLSAFYAASSTTLSASQGLYSLITTASQGIITAGSVQWSTSAGNTITSSISQTLINNASVNNITAYSITGVPLSVKPVVGSNAQEWYDITGNNVVARISNAGGLFLPRGTTHSIGPGAGNYSWFVNTGADGNVGTIIKGHSNTQSADLQQWQNSAGTVLSTINASGQMIIGTNAALLQAGSAAMFSVLQSSSYTPGIIVRRGVNTNPYQQVWQDSNGNAEAYVSFGQFNALAYTTTGNSTGVGSTPFGPAAFRSYPAAGVYGMLISANSAQTADLLRMTDSTGNNVLSTFNASGQLIIGSSSATVSGSPAMFSIVNTRDTNIPLIVLRTFGANTQTGNSIEFQGSAGQFLGAVFGNALQMQGNITAVGQLRAGATTNLGGTINVNTLTGSVGQIIKGVSGQTTDNLQIQDSNAKILSTVNASGQLVIGGSAAIINSGSQAMLSVYVPSASIPGLVIRAGQNIGISGGADIFRIEDNAATPKSMFRINNWGDIALTENGGSLYIGSYAAPGPNATQTALWARSGGATTLSIYQATTGTQTADLLQFKTNSGSVLSAFNASGQLIVGGSVAIVSTSAAMLSIYQSSSSTPAILIQSYLGATNTNNTYGLKFISADGTVPFVISSNGKTGIRSSGSDYGSALSINTGSDTATGITIRANSGTQSSDLQQWQNSAGTVLGAIKANGTASFASVVYTPSAMQSATNPYLYLINQYAPKVFASVTGTVYTTSTLTGYKIDYSAAGFTTTPTIILGGLTASISSNLHVLVAPIIAGDSTIAGAVAPNSVSATVLMRSSTGTASGYLSFTAIGI